VDFRSIGRIQRFETQVTAAVRANKAGIDGPGIRDGVFHCDFGDVRRFDIPDMKIWRIQAWIAFDEEVGLRRVGTCRNAVRRRFPPSCANDRVVLKICPTPGRCATASMPNRASSD
jgi:hypothetical protein